MDGFVCKGRFVRVEVPSGRPGSRLRVFDQAGGVGFQCTEPGNFVTIDEKAIFQCTLGTDEPVKEAPRKQTRRVEELSQEYREMAQRVQELPDIFAETAWQGHPGVLDSCAMREGA